MIHSKAKSLSVLIKEADDIFSQFVRYRDMKDGRIKCFICGASLRFSEAQNMHYIDRDQMATRYDEINCNAGCESCNCFDPTHEDKYRESMFLAYGPDQLYELDHRARSLQKFMRCDLEEMILHYKEKVTQLKKEKL